MVENLFKLVCFSVMVYFDLPLSLEYYSSTFKLAQQKWPNFDLQH